jgi:hypothetical protein
MLPFLPPRPLLFCRSEIGRVPLQRVSISNAKRKQRAKSGNSKFAQLLLEDTNDYPDFAVLLRQLYRRSHPDLLRSSHPDLSKINDQSMQLLNGVLSTVKQANQYPPRTIEDIPFHLKSISGDRLEEHILQIRTAGGDCKKQLTATFEQFFIITGLSSTGKFQWTKDYFPTLAHDHKEEEEL